MADFTRKNRGLETAFPPSGLGKHEPSNLSETVQLVQEFAGPLLRLGNRERRYFTIDGAVGVGVVNAFTGTGGPGVPPENVVRHVEWVSLSHDDPVARQVQLNIFNTNIAASSIAIGSSLFEGAGAAVPQNTLFPIRLGRPILCGPGDELQAAFFALAAVNVGRIRYCFVDYSPAEPTI